MDELNINSNIRDIDCCDGLNCCQNMSCNIDCCFPWFNNNDFDCCHLREDCNECDLEESDPSDT